MTVGISSWLRRRSVSRCDISCRETKLFCPNKSQLDYVYALKSLKNEDLYIGYSADLRTRFKAHNDGRVKSTKANRPWAVVYYEAYVDKQCATKREYQLKKGCYKEELKNRLAHSKNES